jgi:predicted transcriptional regulator
MMSVFSLLIARCGLSQREAASFLGASNSAIDKWSRGARIAPPGVIDALRTLYQQQESAADEAIAQAADQAERYGWPELVELGLASDDHEAEALGWPCVGAQAAMLGIVAANLPCAVVVVPRGSTLATAAAADETDKAKNAT